MNSSRLLCLLFCLLISFTHSLAQQASDFDCGFDALRRPGEAQAMQVFDAQIRQYLNHKQANNTLQKGLFAPPYIIPVVVHIIHNGGSENIPDAQVQTALNHLNDAFAAQGYYGQQGATFNTKIQFCLARRDPDGLATNGITRTQSTLTNVEIETQDLQLKDLNRWNPLDYVNIWVVNEIVSISAGPGVSGYAYFPSAHGLPIDGMVCEAKYFGVSPAEDAVFIHEMGHYFGLYHTFEGGCPNNDCTLDGDRVCDTPPDNATHTACPFNSCGTDVAPGSPFLSDVDDFTGDFMDYSPFPCYNFFTADQSDRMQGTIEIVRKSLLESKVCLSPCSQPIVAAFSALPNPVFAGQTLVLSNNSSNASSFVWTANGNEFAQTQDASTVFTTIGAQIIVLTATNSDPNCEAVSFVVVDVQCPIQAGFTPDQLEAIEGSTITFTNSTTGAGAISYEWSINGQLVSTSTDLSYVFQNSGFYTVILKAIGPFCQQETSVLIKIANPCGLLPEPVVVSFTAQRKLFQPRDMLALPDGSILQCGEHFQQPMVTKWDAQGNLEWNREAPLNGTLTEIESSFDGNFILTGEDSNLFPFILKVDGNGNILWIKTIQSTPTQYFSTRHLDHLAVNPDGTFGFLYESEFNDGGHLSKLSPNGAILWTVKIPSTGMTGSLQTAVDGSGDFVFMTRASNPSGPAAFNVLFIGQDGSFKRMDKHLLPNTPPIWTNNIDLCMHSDGGYSIFYIQGTNSFGQSVQKILVRYNADGTTKWAKRYNLTNGNLYHGSYIRQIPNEEGWLIVDSRKKPGGISLGDYLERLDSTGEVLWTRYLGDTPANDVWVMAPVYLDGRIRAIHCDFFNQDLNLLNINDSSDSIPCVPLVPNGDFTTTMIPSMVAGVATPIPQDISTVDYPLLFSEVTLTKTTACAAVLPCPEICGNLLDDDEDGYVDCYDSDCDCFEKDTTCILSIPVHDFSAKLGWQSTEDAAAVNSIPLVANLNPLQDSIPEIIILEALTVPNQFESNRALIFKGDGSNASNPNMLNLPASVWLNIPPHPTVADLDGNGVPELIFVTNDGKIRVYTNFDPNANPCMTEWVVSTANAWSSNARAYVADFDGDGIGEIFSGNDVFKLDLTNPQLPVLNKVLDGNGAAGQISGIWNPGLSTSVTAADLLSRSDCNGDPDCDGLEIAAGYQIYSIDVDNTDGDGYEIKVQRDLNILDPNNFHQDGYTTVADLNLDGTPEIIVSGTYGQAFNGIYTWNKNGLVQVFQHFNFGRMNGMVAVAELYDDTKDGFVQNFPELIVCKPNGIFCLNLQKAQATPIEPYWWMLPTTDLSGLTGVTVFDFNGDGLNEVVYRDHEHLRVMYAGNAPFPAGVDAERNWFKIVAGSNTADEYPVIADVDHDGQAEIVVTSYLTPFIIDPPVFTNSRGRLRVFESDQFPWLPARPVWNQFNYFGVNINDDLSVPKTQQKHWLEMGGIGSGKRPFNTHLAQVPSLNPFQTNQIKVPDARIVLDSTQCHTDSLDLYFTLCNQGSAVLPAGTPIAFYLGDPSSTAATLLFTHLLNNPPLEIGNCSKLLLKIPASYNATVFAVINDDGSLPTPFNLSSNFPSTKQLECHYENNIVSFNIQNPSLPLDLGPDLSLCKSSVVTISANPNFQRYRWQDGTTAPNFTAFTAGKYWVDAFDACGFRQSDTVNIFLNTLATLDLPGQLTACEGATFDLTASGFQQYTWAPVDSVSCSSCATVQVKASGSFTLHLTAASGDCFVSDSVRIQTHPNPRVQLLALDGGCDTDASITPIVNGEGPFYFLWSNSSVDSVLNTTQSGSYILETTDQNGCQRTDSTSVSDFIDLVLFSIGNSPKCAKAVDGSIELSVLSGTPPLQFLWSNNATTANLSNLSSGDYTVLVSDDNACTETLNVTLSDPPAIQLILQKTDLNCPGDPGSLDLSASGGTPPLLYLWSNGAMTEDLNGLQSGTYTVLISDLNGCTLSDSTTLSVLGSIPVLKVNTDTLNCLKTNGMLSVHSSVANCSYWWNGPGGFTASDSFPVIAQGGNYTVTVSEPLGGCTATANLVVQEDTLRPFIQLAAHLTEIFCDQDSTFLSAAGSSSGPNFEIQWMAASGGSILSGDNNLTLSVGSAGVYTLSITDRFNGCTSTDTVEVLQLGAPTGMVQADSVRCFGESNGAIHILNPSGGTPPFRYSIDNQNFTSNPVFENLAAGTYSVSILDAKDCSFSTSIEIAQPASFSVALTGDSLLETGATAYLQAIVEPFDFIPTQISWTANNVSLIQQQLEHSMQLLNNTLFEIQVFNENGCEAIDTWLVLVEDAYQIYTPNIIYPGNPRQTNQVFLIFGGEAIQEVESFNIFNRWGEQVFSNEHFQPNDETQGWSGDFRGKPVLAGVYVWTSNIRFKDGILKTLRGDFTVIR